MDFLNLIVAVARTDTGVEIPERDYPQLANLNRAIAYLVESQG